MLLDLKSPTYKYALPMCNTVNYYYITIVGYYSGKKLIFILIYGWNCNINIRKIFLIYTIYISKIHVWNESLYNNTNINILHKTLYKMHLYHWLQKFVFSIDYSIYFTIWLNYVPVLWNSSISALVRFSVKAM